MGSEILTGGVVIGFIAYGELYAVILFLVTVGILLLQAGENFAKQEAKV